MNYRLDAFNYIGSLVPYVSMFFLPIITPGRQHWHLSLSSRRCRLDQCSLFAMICWTLTSFFFTLSCNRINPYPLHCAVYLGPPCLSYISPRFIPALHRLLLASVIVFLTTHSSPPRLALYRFLISVAHLLFPSCRSRQFIRYRLVSSLQVPTPMRFGAQIYILYRDLYP